jgi:hypothetical protein
VVLVPVTVDPEAGYGMEPRELVDRLLEIGAVGCNLEDTDHRAGGLVDAGAHGERLAAIRAAAGEAGSRSSSTRAPSARRSSTTAESADKSASRPVSSSHANVSRGDGIVNSPCSRRHRCGPP